MKFISKFDYIIHNFAFTALKKTFQNGYKLSDLKFDLMAGLIVALVAIPLNMSLAIATGVPPQYGLYTAIIAGFIVALVGGSFYQVTGPTAAFVVILFPIVQKFGFAGLAIAGIMAGFIILIMGLTKTGRIIQSIPYPVIIGFTSGIAVVIFSIQMKDFFGFQLTHSPESFAQRWIEYFKCLPNINYTELAVSSSTLLLLILITKYLKKIPAPIIVIPLVTAVVTILNSLFPELGISTIESAFVTDTTKGIPAGIFSFQIPWGDFGSLDYTTLKALFIPAFAIAMLGAIESLLSAVVADGMTNTKHNPNAELVGLGFANIIAPFFGGIPSTGAIARTSTNIKFGARSPFSSMFHAVCMLLVIIFAAPMISKLPMAALSALLVLVAYNMSEWHKFLYIVRVSPKSDVFVLIFCFLLTVIFDMVIGVTIGVFMAAILFMKRTIDLSKGEIFNKRSLAHHLKDLEIPDDFLIYKIVGPMFFGVADKVFSSLHDELEKSSAVIILMDQVPTIDATGLVAFESTLNKIIQSNAKVALVGMQPHAQKVLHKGSHFMHHKKVLEFLTLESAIKFLQITKE